ncbi:DUF6705 family protein [Flavobacterium sp. J27]|uniref:DUF6705 family protein n=1 Tax=Flavobacterium sp. J27 TaxID=2060419 RepID=UPI0010311598|nr:DUF6705 family protein [Flavobacterium sp. J27]
MKYIVLVLLFSTTTFAQTLEEKPLGTFFNPNENKHVYYKDVNNLLNKYVGTWVFDDGTHYFKIQFYKETFHRETPIGNKKITIFTDRIVGHYQYKLNGVVIYDVTDNRYVHSTSGAFFNGLRIFYDEPTNASCGRSIMGKVTLDYSNSNNIEQLTWNRTDTNFETIWCQPFDKTPYKTPTNMILIKQ